MPDTEQTSTETELERLRRLAYTDPSPKIYERKDPPNLARILRRRTVFAISAIIAGALLAIVSGILHSASGTTADTTFLSIILALAVIMAVAGPGGAALLNYLEYGKPYFSRVEIIDLTRAPADPWRETAAQQPSLEGVAGKAATTDALVQMQLPESSLERQLFLTTKRLNQEITELGRRGAINLIIGIITTAVGVSYLGYIVYSSMGDGEDFGWKSGVHTLLRVSIALFIQIFAYFFLRLYKTSLEDIKYYQNEITNIESRWLALAAIDLKNDALLKLVVDSLIKTERNFVLKKGESTLGLERERLEKNEIIELVKEALGTVAKIKPGK
jgi:hypothetical protein